MLLDLHVPHPTASNLVVCPTGRATSDGLALSSRNAYLHARERPYAAALYRGLVAGQKLYEDQGERDASAIVSAAKETVDEVAKEAKANGVGLELDFVSLNDPNTLNGVEGEISDAGAVLSGAMWLGEKRTRLIDNVLLGVQL
jgi:pantoate--beta-alanine ligase